MGLWRVSRRIVLFFGGPPWTFMGRAEIDDDHFIENGFLTTGAITLPASRLYALVQNRTGAVDVKKQDGSRFVTLQAVPVQDVIHDCGDDRYEGRFMFLDPDRWIEIWRVRGPRKAYRSITCFTRL